MVTNRGTTLSFANEHTEFGVTSYGFADDPFDVRKFVMFQFVTDPSDVDAPDDEGSFWIETESGSGYGLVEGVNVSGSLVEIALTSTGRTELASDGFLVVNYAGDERAFDHTLRLLRYNCGLFGIPFTRTD